MRSWRGDRRPKLQLIALGLLGYLFYAYGIYVIERAYNGYYLCFIMPAFLVVAVQMFRRRGMGIVLAPPLYVLGFTLIFSLAVAELVKPRFEEPVDGPALVAASALSALFAVLGSAHLAKLRLSPSEPDRPRGADAAVENTR